MRKYKGSYRGRRGLRRFAVTFRGAPKLEVDRKCIHCGGDLEPVPMVPGTCYDCYREGKHRSEENGK